MVLVTAADDAGSNSAAEENVRSIEKGSWQDTIVSNGHELDTTPRVSQPLSVKLNGNVSAACFGSAHDNVPVKSRDSKQIEKLDGTEGVLLQAKEHKKSKDKKHKKHSDERKHKSRKDHHHHKKNGDRDRKEHFNSHHHSSTHHPCPISESKLIANDAKSKPDIEPTTATSLQGLKPNGTLSDGTPNGSDTNHVSFGTDVSHANNHSPKVQPITIKLSPGSSHVVYKDDEKPAGKCLSNGKISKRCIILYTRSRCIIIKYSH